MTDDLNNHLRLASSIVGAYVSNNPVPMSDLPGMIRSVHSVLGSLADGTASSGPTDKTPAVPVKKSITPDYIICLEDGKKLKMLKRYLRSRYKLSPDEYRAKWGLMADYPMVAPNYSERRSTLAKKSGLGRTGKAPKGKKKAAAARG